MDSATYTYTMIRNTCFMLDAHMHTWKLREQMQADGFYCLERSGHDVP